MEYLESDKDILRLKGGVHEIDIYVKVEFNGQRKVIIRCEDDDSCTEDINGDWVEEYSMASFSPTIEQIDQIIEKLKSAKEFLKGDKQ